MIANHRYLGHLQGFSDSPIGKESTCNAEDPSSIPGLGRSSWRRKWQPTPVFLPGRSHGQRSLAGYSHGVGRDLATRQQQWISTSSRGRNMFLLTRYSHTDALTPTSCTETAPRPRQFVLGTETQKPKRRQKVQAPRPSNPWACLGTAPASQ